MITGKIKEIINKKAQCKEEISPPHTELIFYLSNIHPDGNPMS